MPLITTRFPNLTGGVSQQPSSQRLLNQCEAQENALPLLVGGLIKRPPSNHVGEITTYLWDEVTEEVVPGLSVDLSTSFNHVVTRDSNEEFIISLSGVSNSILVTGIDGIAKEVLSDLDVSTYLSSGTPRTAFKAVTIADVTFLVNNTVDASMSADTSLYSRGETTKPNEGLIWIKSSGQGVGFRAKVTGVGEDIEEVVRVHHSPAAQLIGGDGTAENPNIYGYPPNPPSTSDVAESMAIGTQQPDTLVDTLAFTIHNDNSVSNTEVATVTKNDTTLTLTLTVSSSDFSDTILLGSDDYDTIAELVTHINDLGTATPEKAGWVATLRTVTNPDESALLTDIEATDILGAEKDLNMWMVTTKGLDGLTNYTTEQSGSVIFIENTVEDFQLTVEDSLGQNAHKVIKDEVGDFNELPPVAKNGFKVLVKGDPESEVDDYYVKFETNGGGDFGEGIWLETIGPNIKYQWDYNTLPHILIRQSDGTFLVKRADGITPDATLAPSDADYSAFKFIDRECGSNLTNPLPSFAGRPINDISFFKNRLTILSGEDCALSEAGELFNFFRTTTTVLMDTAPIDVGVGGTDISKLDKAVPFSDRLLLFSDRTQFVLQGEAILSPMTASISQATNFDITTSATPTPAGNSLFFAFNRGAYSGIREFYKTSETTIDFDAVESTAQCPKYIPGIVRKLTASTHEDILAVLSGTTTNELYLYKYFKTSERRIQSAWFKFSLGNCEIVDINFIAQSLYLIVERDGKTFIERMDLQTGLVDIGKSYVTNIDRRALVTPGEAGNTITLPYDIVSGDVTQVVSTDGELMTIDSSTTDTVTLNEDFTDTDSFYVGTQYIMTYELSEPVLKQQREGGGYEMIAAGRHQLRYMTIVFADTATFNIKVTPEIGGSDGETIEYPFTGRFLGAGGYLGSVPSESGDFRFPVFAESDSVSIIIENDSPLPSNIQSIEFEAYYTSRSQRFS
jgi:hypothetical protein